MKSIGLQVGRNTIEVLVLGEDDLSHTDEIVIRADREDDESIRSAASTVLRERHWWLKDDVLPTEPTQRFALHVAPGVTVELTIIGERIEKRHAEDICEALALFWMRLRNKERWALKSVQIPAVDVSNAKSGELMRGCEFPLEGRFYVYPTALRETGLYRGVLPCTWLQGTVIHEATHVCLELPLDGHWVDAGDLGWSNTLPGTLVRYPGGAENNRVNLRPEECATRYGTYGKDDDRAESVVAFLSGGALHASRREVLLKELHSESPDFPDWSVEELSPALPPLPKVLLRIAPKPSGSFFRPRPGAGSGPSIEPTVYAVDDYRRLLAEGVLR